MNEPPSVSDRSKEILYMQMDEVQWDSKTIGVMSNVSDDEISSPRSSNRF